MNIFNYIKFPILNDRLLIPTIFILLCWLISGASFLVSFLFWLHDLRNPYPSKDYILFLFLAFFLLFVSFPFVGYLNFYFKGLTKLRTQGSHIVCENFSPYRSLFLAGSPMVHGYRIVVIYNNIKYVSDVFLIDPSPYLSEKKISLYINKNNPKKYLVDIEPIVREGVRAKHTKKKK